MSSLWQKGGVLLELPGSPGTLMYDDVCCCEVEEFNTCDEYTTSPGFITPVANISVVALFSWRRSVPLPLNCDINCPDPPPTSFSPPFLSKVSNKLSWEEPFGSPSWECLLPEEATRALGNVNCFADFFSIEGGIKYVYESGGGHLQYYGELISMPAFSFGTTYTLLADTTQAPWTGNTVNACWVPDVVNAVGTPVFEVTF